MYKKVFKVDNENVVIQLETEFPGEKPIIDMNYLGMGMRQTILREELTNDLENLIPSKIGNSFFDNDSHVIMTIMEQLKKVIQKHINHYKRLLQADLATYVAEAIVFLDSYFEQILNKSFEPQKKKTFHLYFNFFNKQLLPE